MKTKQPQTNYSPNNAKIKPSEKKKISKSLLDILTLIVYVILCVNFVTKVMTAHEKVFNNPRRFKSLTSLSIDILLPPLRLNGRFY